MAVGILLLDINDDGGDIGFAGVIVALLSAGRFGVLVVESDVWDVELGSRTLLLLLLDCGVALERGEVGWSLSVVNIGCCGVSELAVALRLIILVTLASELDPPSARLVDTKSVVPSNDRDDEMLTVSNADVDEKTVVALEPSAV